MINKQRVKRLRSVIYSFIVLLILLPIILLIAIFVSMIGFMRGATERLDVITDYVASDYREHNDPQRITPQNQSVRPDGTDGTHAPDINGEDDEKDEETPEAGNPAPQQSMHNQQGQPSQAGMPPAAGTPTPPAGTPPAGTPPPEVPVDPVDPAVSTGAADGVSAIPPADTPELVESSALRSESRKKSLFTLRKASIKSSLKLKS